MKWSNAVSLQSFIKVGCQVNAAALNTDVRSVFQHVRELESLEERLLCVEITKTSVELVKRVLEVVASIASFVSFLPLANYVRQTPAILTFN